MDNNMNGNEIVRHIKRAMLPKVDVADRVMDKLYKLQERNGNGSNRILFKPRPRRIVWIATVALLLVAAASVSAAAVFQADWNGIQISVQPNESTGQISDGKVKETFKEVLEKTVTQLAGVWKKVSIEDAQKDALFPYPLLRPQHANLKPYESFGIVPQAQDYRLQSERELWAAGVYDYYKQNNRHIVVRQNFDSLMTESVQNPQHTLSLMFKEPWVNVEINDNTMAMFKQDGKENTLVVSYKMADNKVISLELTGDADQDVLIKLAKAYTK